MYPSSTACLPSERRGKAGTKRSQRFILDTLPGKCNLEDAPIPQMPERGSLGEVALRKYDKLTIGATDLSLYVYSLKVP